MFENANWITHKNNVLHEPVCFIKDFFINKEVKKATISITSLFIKKSLIKHTGSCKTLFLCVIQFAFSNIRI